MTNRQEDKDVNIALYLFNMGNHNEHISDRSLNVFYMIFHVYKINIALYC